MGINVIESNKRKRRVYLFRTDTYDKSKFYEVYHLIAFLSKTMNICLIQTDGQEYVWDHLQPYNSTVNFEKMDEMGFYSEAPHFSTIPFDLHRLGLSIKAEDVVVVLTSEGNNDDCFSYYDLYGNMVVSTSEWERFTSANPKFPIALTIIENIIKISLGVDFTPLFYKYSEIPKRILNNEKQDLKQRSAEIDNIVRHFVSEVPTVRHDGKIPGTQNFNLEMGKLNELKNVQGKIVIEIKTSLEKNSSIRLEIDPNVDLNDILKFLEPYVDIRNEFHRQLGLPELGLYDVAVRKNGEIALPAINICFDLEPLQATLYIFFLLCPFKEGIKAAEIENYQFILVEIYKAIKSTDHRLKERELTIQYLATGSFREKKSKLNSKITKRLSDPPALYYRIEGSKLNKLRVDLPERFIKIELPQLLKIAFIPLLAKN